MKQVVRVIVGLVSLGAAVGLTACGAADSTTLVESNAAATVRVDGSGQQAFVGQALATPIGVQVVDAASHAVAGQRRIRFAVASGSGSVSDTVVLSDSTGHATVDWTLGATPGLQRLAVSLPDVPSSRDQEAIAQAIASDGGDQIVISGATSGIIGVLVRHVEDVQSYTLVWPDTVIHFLPRTTQGGWEEVTAFTAGHPPVAIVHPWTDGVDTVRVAFQPPIEVPFTIWVTYDYDASIARARFDLDALDALWRSSMAGLRVGRIQIDSAPGLYFVCGGSTPGSFHPKSINVYFMNYIDMPEACDAGTIRMNANSSNSLNDIYRFVLAHEVGHAMGLQHVSDTTNVMWPTAPAPGSRLLTGQIYWMHFDVNSALNAVMGVNPAALRSCTVTFSAHCPAQTFVSW